MKMRGLLTAGTVLLAVLLSGCSTTVKTAPSAAVGPFEFGGLARTDYVVVGTVSGSAQCRRFLGFGKPDQYGCRASQKNQLGSGQSRLRRAAPALWLVFFPLGIIPMAATMHADAGKAKAIPRTIEGAAAYDALTKCPGADLILPMMQTTERSGLRHIAWTESATVTGLAVRLKSDADLKR